MEEAKTTSNGIAVQVAEAEKTEKDIDETREKYRPTGTLILPGPSDADHLHTKH